MAITAARIGMVQFLSGVLVVIATLILPWMQGSDLTSQLLHTIQCALVMLVPSFLLLYSSMARNSPAWRAFAQGLLSIPFGAAAIAFFAITLGAPIGMQDAAKTLYWSLFMSTLIVRPSVNRQFLSLNSVDLILFMDDVGCTCSNSLGDLLVRLATNLRIHEVIAQAGFIVVLVLLSRFHCRPSGSVELSICIPAHGAAVGAWVGAWPMPLDWDREWQEWPISCTYGAVGGYLLGLLVASVVLICKKHGKTD